MGEGDGITETEGDGFGATEGEGVSEGEGMMYTEGEGVIEGKGDGRMVGEGFTVIDGVATGIVSLKVEFITGSGEIITWSVPFAVELTASTEIAPFNANGAVGSGEIIGKADEREPAAIMAIMATMPR